MNRLINWNLPGFALLLLFFACSSSDEVKVYRLAKTPTREQALPKPNSETAGILWETPLSWEEKPAHGIRVGSFVAKRDNTVDISVIFLDGKAGGDLANVNRWRQQIDLGPWTASEFSSQTEDLEIQLGKAKLVDFKNNNDQRTIAVIVPYKHGTWFVKMVGPAEASEQEKPIFHTFLTGLKATR